MYRERIAETPVKSAQAQRLRALMLNYHDYQNQQRSDAHLHLKATLAQWQSDRLKITHADLYENLNFRDGIDFLLLELYGAKDFSARDRDLERIFPKLIKLLPEKLIGTVANLVELNLLTEQLDNQMAKHLLEANAENHLDEATYLTAYIESADRKMRERQLELVAIAGNLLDRHARNPILRFSLSVSEKPARKAGLDALHNFLLRGFNAFYAMQDVELLMQTVIDRESAILSRIYKNEPNPFFLASR